MTQDYAALEQRLRERDAFLFFRTSGDLTLYSVDASKRDPLSIEAADAIAALTRERDDLRAALEKIANFAPGYGEIAERIATIARHALWPELAAMAAEEARLSSATSDTGEQS